MHKMHHVFSEYFFYCTSWSIQTTNKRKMYFYHSLDIRGKDVSLRISRSFIPLLFFFPMCCFMVLCCSLSILQSKVTSPFLVSMVMTCVHYRFYRVKVVEHTGLGELFYMAWWALLPPRSKTCILGVISSRCPPSVHWWGSGSAQHQYITSILLCILLCSSKPAINKYIYT